MSNPKPEITFRINMETLNRQGHLVPNRTEVAGNETRSEADDKKFLREVFLPGLIPGTNVQRKSHGSEFKLYGQEAYYMKDLYCVGKPDDLLSVVSIVW